MGIRGFIRNTVEAIRRFFNGSETESDPVNDSSSIQYIDEAPTTEEIIVEEAATEKVVAEDIVTEDIVAAEIATEDIATAELVTADVTIQPPELIEGGGRLRQDQPTEGSEWLPEDIVTADIVVEETTIDPSIVESAMSALNEKIDEPEAENIFLAENEALATEASFPVAFDLAESNDVDPPELPVDIADDLLDSHLAIDDQLDDIRPDDTMLGDAILDDAMLDDDDIWNDEGQDDNFIEPLPPVPKIPPRKPQRKLVAPVVELDILNHPIDRASEVDNSFVEQSPILEALPEARHNRITEVVELDILHYPVDTAYETEVYLNEVILSNDPPEEEPESRLPESINQLDDSVGIHVQSGEEKVALASALESLLFVAERPVDVAHLAKILGQPMEEIRLGLRTLDQSYTTAKRGLRIQDHEEKFQLVTAPFSASIVEDFLSFNLSTKLSGPALEALAVVAYRQPVTRAQVEAVRGVDCASVLRSLIQLGLIEESGRLETLGRPILYNITELFMQHFGLLKMSELPPLEIKEEDLLLSTTELSEL